VAQVAERFTPAADDDDRGTLLERAGSAAAGVGSFGSGRPRLRMALQIGLLVLIFAFLAAFLITQWSKLPDFDWRFRPEWLALAFAGVATFMIAEGEIWRLILRALGERLDAPAARAVWGQSLIARYVPTSALMVVGRVVLAERHGVQKRVCLASIVYELGIAVSSALIVGSYFVITLPALDDRSARWAILVIVPIVLAALHPRVFRPLADFGLRKLGREPLPSALPFGRVLAFVLAYFGCWAAIGLAVFAFARGLHPVDTADLPFVGASYAVAFCVAVLTFIVPSGLGTRDATLATALASALPGAVATAIAVAFRLFQTAVELLYVGAVTLLARRAERRRG